MVFLSNVTVQPNLISNTMKEDWKTLVVEKKTGHFFEI